MKFFEVTDDDRVEMNSDRQITVSIGFVLNNKTSRSLKCDFYKGEIRLNLDDLVDTFFKPSCKLEKLNCMRLVETDRLYIKVDILHNCWLMFNDNSKTSYLLNDRLVKDFLHERFSCPLLFSSEIRREGRNYSFHKFEQRKNSLRHSIYLWKADNSDQFLSLDQSIIDLERSLSVTASVSENKGVFITAPCSDFHPELCNYPNYFKNIESLLKKKLM